MIAFAMDKQFDECDNEYDAKRDIHTGKGQRRKLDCQDRHKVYKEIKFTKKPLQTASTYLVNICNGCVATEKVNGQNAL